MFGRENSKSVREGKPQSIVWINTVTYGWGSKWIFGRENSRVLIICNVCGRENSITRSEGYAWWKLDRNIFSGFLLQTLAVRVRFSYFGKWRRVLENRVQKCWQEIRWGSSATLIISCRWLKYMCICWKHENGVRQSRIVGFINGQYQLRISQG